MNTAKLIEGMIPDELRLASHPDATLVNEALATVIAAMNDSDAVTLSGMRSDVRKALTAYFNGTFSKHISEEDEAWSAMKAKAALAPKPHEVVAMDIDNAADEDAYNEAMERALTLLPSLDADGRAHVNAAIKRYHKGEPAVMVRTRARELKGSKVYAPASFFATVNGEDIPLGDAPTEDNAHWMATRYIGEYLWHRDNEEPKASALYYIQDGKRYDLRYRAGQKRENPFKADGE